METEAEMGVLTQCPLAANSGLRSKILKRTCKHNYFMRMQDITLIVKTSTTNIFIQMGLYTDLLNTTFIKV